MGMRWDKKKKMAHKFRLPALRLYYELLRIKEEEYSSDKLIKDRLNTLCNNCLAKMFSTCLF
jgi:hypothetical protein